MSLDYPLYQEMLRRGSRARWFWRIGDWLCYTGILGFVFVLIMWPFIFFFKFSNTGMAAAAGLVMMAAVYVAGNSLKKVSYRIALGEGIDIVKYFENTEDKGQPPK